MERGVEGLAFMTFLKHFLGASFQTIIYWQYFSGLSIRT